MALVSALVRRVGRFSASNVVLVAKVSLSSSGMRFAIDGALGQTLGAITDFDPAVRRAIECVVGMPIQALVTAGPVPGVHALALHVLKHAPLTRILAGNKDLATQHVKGLLQ